MKYRSNFYDCFVFSVSFKECLRFVVKKSKTMLFFHIIQEVMRLNCPCEVLDVLFPHIFPSISTAKDAKKATSWKCLTAWELLGLICYKFKLECFLVVRFLNLNETLCSIWDSNRYISRFFKNVFKFHCTC